MKRSLIFILFCLLAVSVSAIGIEEVSHFSYGNPDNILIENNYLYISAGKNLLIYDITDTLTPEFCSSITLYDSPVFQMKMHKEHIYIMYSTLHNASDEITIIDVTDKYNPRLDFRGLGRFQPRDICFADTLAFITGTGLGVLNIVNPSDPVVISSFCKPNSNGVAVNGKYLYVGAGYLSTYDISDPANPVFICDCPLPSYDLGDFTVNDSLLLGTANGCLIGFDISEPSKPIAMWLVPFEVSDYEFTAKDTILAINNTDFMYFDLTPFNTYNSYKYIANSDRVTEMAFYGDKIFFNNSYKNPTIYIYDMPSSSDLNSNTSFEVGYSLKKTVIDGDFLYALSENDVIYIYYFNEDKSEYVISGSIKLNDWSKDICIVDKTLYVSGSNGINIIDVTDKTAPSLVSKYTLGQLLTRMERKGDLLFVADFYRGIHIFDIKDRNNPIHLLKDESCSNLYVTNFILTGDLMVVNSVYDYYDDYSKITVEDISCIDSITVLAENYVDARINDFAVVNDTLIACAVATCYTDGLWLLDLNPSDLIGIIKYKTSGWRNAICYTAPKLFVSDYKYIHEYWLCPKNGLTKTDSLETPDYLTDFTYSDKFMFTAGYYGSGITYSVIPSPTSGVDEKKDVDGKVIEQRVCSERFFTMSLPESKSKLQVSFYDVSGREVELKYYVSEGSLIIDTEMLASGLFFVRILADNETEFVKITKINK